MASCLVQRRVHFTLQQPRHWGGFVSERLWNAQTLAQLYAYIQFLIGWFTYPPVLIRLLIQ